jgi:hypothetical protein
MKPTPIFVAAAGFAMIGACSVKTEDNSAENVDANSATNESVLPVTDNEVSAGDTSAENPAESGANSSSKGQ